jgi:hypothetical protein
VDEEAIARAGLQRQRKIIKTNRMRDFRLVPELYENFAVLGYYAVSADTSLLTFRREHFGKELPLLAE